MALPAHITETIQEAETRLPDPAALLSSFASAFVQPTRLLKLHFASGCGLPANLLLPHRLTGSEAINEDFRYELEALSADAHLELKRFIGVPAQVSLLTDAGSERHFCGLVTEAHQEESDGGFALYRLVLESGLSVLRLRRNARVFTGINVREVTRRILAGHLETNQVLNAAFSVEDRCKGLHAAQPFWMQYNESDFDYLRRIWAREGISFVVQPAAGSSPEHPQHTLVLFDEGGDLAVNAASPVRFHRADGTETSDAITRWTGHRGLQASSAAGLSWDPVEASLRQVKEASAADQGKSGRALASTLAQNRHHASTEDRDADELQTLTTRRMKALEGRMRRFEGEGSVRAFQAGTWFTLTQHPIHDQDAPQDREFLITHLELDAENNLPKDLATGLSAFFSKVPEGAASTRGPAPPYRNRFTCLRRAIPCLPEEIAPPDPGLITAQVVGPGGAAVHTDELGRIRVRFLFARDQDHPEAGASGTDADSAWIRQVETWGSQGFGGSFLPRVGDEVVVQFLGGDPDKPIITGSVHNRARTPTSFSQASSLPAEKALSGLRSRMHHGSGGNELVLDDTPSQLRARLASDHAASHLNLGYLVHPRNGGAGTPRGEGFELRTDAWGAVRAEKGLLFTTYRTTGPHLEADPLASQLESGLELAYALSEVGQRLGAESCEAGAAVKQLKDAVRANRPQGGRNVPAFQTPVLGLASPDGILSATGASHVLSAGEHLQFTSGGDTNLGVGRKLAMAIRSCWSVFVANTGIKLFATKEDFFLQAQQGSIQILASQDATLTSARGELSVLAKRRIQLTAGQCQIEVTDKDVNLYMAGAITIKGGLNLGGARTGSLELPVLPKEGEIYDQGFRIVDEASGEPLSDMEYELTTDSGKKLRGFTNAGGYTGKHAASAEEFVEIKVFPKEIRGKR